MKIHSRPELVQYVFSTIRFRPVYLLLAGIAIAVAFWFIDAVIDHAVFNAGSFPESLVPESSTEIYMRTLVSVLFFLFGLVAYRSSRLFLDLATREAKSRRETESLAKLLSGLVPICAHCKKIRDEDDNWQPVESYIAARSEARFSHGLCPDCISRHYGEGRSDSSRGTDGGHRAQ